MYGVAIIVISLFSCPKILSASHCLQFLTRVVPRITFPLTTFAGPKYPPKAQTRPQARIIRRALHWFGWIVANPSALELPDTHMTVQGMQQKSHSTPSPHGHEMHGFVEPLMGFEMDETTDEDVDEGGMAGR
jgi:hypothetical protein